MIFWKGEMKWDVAEAVQEAVDLAAVEEVEVVVVLEEVEVAVDLVEVVDLAAAVVRDLVVRLDQHHHQDRVVIQDQVIIQDLYHRHHHVHLIDHR